MRKASDAERKIIDMLIKQQNEIKELQKQLELAKAYEKVLVFGLDALGILEEVAK